MSKGWKVLLAIVAVACFAVALSYPIRYRMEEQRTVNNMDQLIALRDQAVESEKNLTDEPESAPEEAQAEPTEEPAKQPASGGESTEETVARAPLPTRTAAAVEAEAAPKEEAEPIQTGAASAGEEVSEEVAVSAIGTEIPAETKREDGGGTEPRASAAPAATPEPTPTPVPTLDPKRLERLEALPYPELERRSLNEDEILPEYRKIYDLNHDMVGWITIPDTVIDYPVVQSEDSEFYLSHGFFGEENNNGQIILDAKCDPYTPSYNLIISGHNMKSDLMFGTLDEYRDRNFWSKHKIIYFNTLMERKEYVVFAAFYSADYDVDETGFRYSVDIQYWVDAQAWLEEIQRNRLYDAGIDVEFGDEFLTLTTCNKARRKDGRFVVVCRRIRKGEELK